jgi:hypothetical protein
MRRADAAHLWLLLVALGLAYAAPFELLVLAYVILGPAHYTTEISWLHDRKYFLSDRGGAAVLALLALGAAFVGNPSWFGFALWSGLIAGALFAATRSAGQGAVLLIAATGLTAVMYTRAPALAVVGVLLPTLIHVSLFTLVFMTLGAWRSRSGAQALLIGCYLAAIGLVLAFPPSPATIVPGFTQVGKEYFGNVAPALSRVFGIRGPGLDGRLWGLLAFVYTYHYLNWFIKADVIRWADIPPQRLALVATVSVLSTGLYIDDYAFGFSVLLALSLVHVVLEFPLNALAIRQLSDAVGRGMRGRAAAIGRLAGHAPAPPLSRKPPRAAARR